jgi:hypothetical protein
MTLAKISCIGIAAFNLFTWATLAGCAADGIVSAEMTEEEDTAEVSEAVTMTCPVGANCGLTWVKAYHTSTTGQDSVTCHDSSVTPSNSCNPYSGDTDCKLSRPILCIRKDGSTSNGFVGSFYNGWAAGNIGLTHPVAGTSLTSLDVANQQCVKEFGAGWRMAEHHDGGGGWGWTAYGNLNDTFSAASPSHTLANRFWVHVNDQPQGNCW